MYYFNVESIEVLLQKLQTDLEAIRKLMPNTPALLSVEGVWAAMDHQYARSLALLSAAEAAGYADSETLRTKADVMGRMGLFEDALPVIAHAVDLDPANTNMLTYQGVAISYTRRPAEAIQALERAKTHAPEPLVLDVLQAYIRYLYIGDPAGLAAINKRLEHVNNEAFVRNSIGVALLQQNYKKARALAQQLPAREPARDVLLMIPTGVGGIPLADLAQGDIDLLLADSGDAKNKGRAVLEFVAGQQVTRRNEWFLKMLESDGRLLSGDKRGAIAAAHSSLTLMPASLDAIHWTIAAYRAAVVYSWAGDDAEAVDLLEQLTKSVPGVGPGEITRSPFFTVPLAKNARYQALVRQLEAQMSATKL
jgi:tetratricopeptide (TPR) repeat protein